MREILRVHIKMPKIVDEGYFEAWLDNNGRFGRDDGKAMIFHSYQDVMAKLHEGNENIIDILIETGCEFEIEFYDQQYWRPHHSNIERHLVSLCDIV